MKKDIYLIHPVAQITPEEKDFFWEYVRGREKETGLKYHFPIRDVDQNDPTGMRICCEHRDAAEEVKNAELYFTPKSNGSMLDAGMFVYQDKPIEIINENALKGLESFASDFFKNYSFHDFTGSESFKRILQKKEEIKNSSFVICEFGKTPEKYLEMGMAFMSRKPILLKNRNEVKPTSHKSYENVFLEIDKKSNQYLSAK